MCFQLLCSTHAFSDLIFKTKATKANSLAYIHCFQVVLFESLALAGWTLMETIK